MGVMPEETLKEIAATNEPPRGLVSQEFFFLLQRMDRMEERLSGEIKQTNKELSSEIKRVEEKLSERTAKIISRTTTLIITVVLGCAGIIVTLALALRH